MIWTNVEPGRAQARIRPLQKVEQRKAVAPQVLDAADGHMDQGNDQQCHHKNEAVSRHGKDQRDEQVNHQRPQQSVEVGPGKVLHWREEDATPEVEGQ